MFIVVNETHVGITYAFGPFSTRARASGYGFSNFGALTFGNPNKWRVLRVGSTW